MHKPIRSLMGHALLRHLMLIANAVAFSAVAESPQVALVPKWGRFEHTLKSSFVYSNALQQASLTVVFTSPLAETFTVPGFWDGDRTWRVRFAPDQPGTWRFQTFCSDAANAGLHHVSGEFLCAAATGAGRFNRHGPVRVARDHRHLEHADGTPFFWLADTAWNGACVSTSKDWETYVRTRGDQHFTVIQWSVPGGTDLKKQFAFAGREHIEINPGFFQRLDNKLQAVSGAGLLSAVVPLGDLESPSSLASTLPDDQAALLVRYALARWGADPVAWLLAVEGDAQARKIARWKRIGQSVFADMTHAPVVLYPGDTPWLLDEFRDQSWVDAFGYQAAVDVSEEDLKYTLIGPTASEWKRSPVRPLIAFGPCENALGIHSRKRLTSDDVRRAAYWSLLLSPLAGFSYCGRGIADWDTTLEPGADRSKASALPAWQVAMFLPGARQMTQFGAFVDATTYWRLRPRPNLLAAQAVTANPQNYIAAAATEANELAVIYTTELDTVEVAAASLPASPSVTWLNPRSGQKHPGVAVVAGRTFQFPAPEPGDWLLVIKAGTGTRSP